MPRRSHRYTLGRPDVAIGYLSPPSAGLPDAEQALSLWAEAQDLDLRVVIKDTGREGRLSERPAFAGALQLIWETGAGVLLVDRLASLAPEPLFQAMAATLIRNHGARVVSVARGEEDCLEKLEPMMEAFQEFYDLDRRVRVQAGLVVAQRQRRRVSRVVPYGFNLAADGDTLVPYGSEQEVIRLISELRAKRLSLRKIGETLTELGHKPKDGKKWWPQTISDILARGTDDPQGSSEQGRQP